MKFLSSKKIFISKLIIPSIVFSTFIFYAYSTGITGRTRKSITDGCNCHGSSPTPSVNVTINGPSSLSPGQKGTYSVTISGGPLVRGGTNIAASSGTLSPISGSGLQSLSGELTHTSPKSPSAGTVTFQFEYTAPSTPGNVILYANGNSVNFNGSNNGDQWNFASDKTIMVGTTSVDDNISGSVENFKLEQNYPNPFNPKTTIGYELSVSSIVRLVVYDIFGREIAILVNEPKQAGVYEVEFDANKYGLTSGVYFYQLVVSGANPLSSGSFISTRKLILSK